MATPNSILNCGAQNSMSNNRKTKRLFISIRYGHVTNVEALLQEGADLDGTDSKGRTPLLLASLHRRKRIVDLLIKTGANVEGKCEDKKYTVLHCASHYGWTKIVRSLVKKVSDIHVVDIRGDTAMHHATRLRRLKVGKCLVKAGTDINIKNLAGFTPLITAAQLSEKSFFDLLLKSGANVDGDEWLLLYYALINDWRETVQFLVKKIPELSTWSRINEIVSSVKSSKRHLEILKLLMGNETNAKTRNNMLGEVALLKATSALHIEVLKWLVERVPNLNKGDHQGRTALHIATIENQLDMVKILVEKGADMNIKEERGNTALIIASAFGYFEIVKYLVEKGANINTRDGRGTTALIKASLMGQHEVVKWFVGNVDTLNEEEEELLHEASARGWKDIVQSLIKRKCNLDARNEWGETALIQACCNRQFETAQVLLLAGANWNIVDTAGLSLLSYLVTIEEPEFLKLFIENGLYFKPVDYHIIVKSSLLEVLQDTKLSCRTFLNKFNHHDLPQLYELPVSGSLPRIENMKIISGSNVAQIVEQTVAFQIQNIGHCNVLEIRPIALSVLSVRCLVEYYKKPLQN